MNDRVGVVLMAYGSPASPDAIEAYYTDIRRGRPPTSEQLEDLRTRYAAIGGTSPLNEICAAQRDRLQYELDAAEPGRFTVSLGFKHAAPKVAETAAIVAASGVDRIVGLALAPHYSSASIGEYLAQVHAGIDAAGTTTPVIEIRSWAREPAFIEFLAMDLVDRLAALRHRSGGRVRVLFSAHSLPERVAASGDPYPDELRATATAVAAAAGLADDDWQIAWQSAGRTPEPWLGPDVGEVIDDLGAGGDVAGVIVCACGFVADHLEVLYDLDVDAARRAVAAGLAFDRTACVNDDATVMAALAVSIRRAVA